ncbi:hypothetical protein NQZ68_019313 [Dissostichus eleginoides]|nr:hypothetical protein NQZ68_019313 [Dissostichus eleginoides]
MARHDSTQEALEIIMHSDCEDGSSSSSSSSSSSVDFEADTEEASEATEDASEVGTDQLESNSDSSEAENGSEKASGVRNRDGAFSGPRCPTRGFTKSAEHCGSTTSYPDRDAVMTR